MAEMMMLLKPAPFLQQRSGDPEQLHQDFLEYVATFKMFLTATNTDGAHTAAHGAEPGGGRCKGCVRAKATLQLVGGKEMEKLFNHVGLVEAADTFERSLEKVLEGIKKQTNQASARFKLFQQMPQNGSNFVSWYSSVKEQADRCTWTGYDAKMAARDAILFQTDNKRLQRKIMAEDLKYDEAVKFGLALEQGDLKVEQIRSKNGNGNGSHSENGISEEVRMLREEVRRLQVKEQPKRKQSSKSSAAVACRTCCNPRCEDPCIAVDSRCYDCGKTGHFRYAAACSKVEKQEKVRAVQGKQSSPSECSKSSTDTESQDSDGNVAQVRICKQSKQHKQSKTESRLMAELSMTAKDHQRLGPDIKANLVIDSGVDSTLLCEADWLKLKSCKRGEGLRLKKSRKAFHPFGSKKHVPVLGRSKCMITATGGALVESMVYVVQGEKHSLLGLQDSLALGIITVKPEGKVEANEGTIKSKILKLPNTILNSKTSSEETDGDQSEVVPRHHTIRRS